MTASAPCTTILLVVNFWRSFLLVWVSYITTPSTKRYQSQLCSILCNNLNGKRISRRIDTCICITESLCCTPETNKHNIANQLYSNIKLKLKKKKKKPVSCLLDFAIRLNLKGDFLFVCLFFWWKNYHGALYSSVFLRGLGLWLLYPTLFLLQKKEEKYLPTFFFDSFQYQSQ